MTSANPAQFVKRSVSLSGHRTSVALEQAFWDVIDGAAEARGQSLASLIAGIDRRRDPEQNLASALRLFALAEIQRAG
ncbi:ribbon-helix-helix domain-containing protein [Parvularcula sp. ZS-1/3]|uniref:Ribbon-helix-helix domain-containing protein n=1 Tax=Parvularcula mediterranea TaxID=2732508 RepID=A0A7Y3W648_9PROT|nr:ribbon-helix-helix domain-containing protein [Parvularcula mediterranea]